MQPIRLVTCPVLIGRTDEVAALVSLIDAAGGGQGCAALISGEAGLGKSRLAAEAKRLALARGFTLLQGDCFQTDRSHPYGPLLDLVRAFFAGHPSALLAPEREPVVREFARLFPELASLLPQPVPAPLPQTLDPEQHRRRLHSVLLQVLTSEAARRPVLLIVEDVHWCDESSLDVLLHLMRRCTDQPVCFVFTYRGEERAPPLRHWLAQLDREHRALELALARLSPAEVDAMLRAILAAPAPVHAEILGTVSPLAEGNPFFVEEVLKALVAAGELRFVDGAWERASGQRQPGAVLPVPRSVQDAVTQRAEHVSAGAQRALTLAAVAGRRFDFALLQRVLGCDEDELLPLIKELIAAQLVVEVSADRFAFRHALVQQAVYGALLARERRSWHRTVAGALAALADGPSPREARLADLAHHTYAAGAWAEALEYSRRAGESALELRAPGAAIVHLTRAADAARRLGVAPPSEVYHARGQAYATRGEFDRARGDYERALETARLAPDGAMEWRAMMALGSLWAGRDYAQAGVWFGRASDQAARLADPTLRARSLNRLGNWLVNTGRIEEGLGAHRVALEIFDERRDTPGMAESLDLLGTAEGMRGARIQAVEQLGRAIALFRTLGDAQRLTSSLAMRALQAMPGASETTTCPLRTRDECVHDAVESLRLARQGESAAGQAFAENALAHTFLAFGEYGPALAHAQEARRIATEIAHRQWMVATSYALGHTYLLLLAPTEAIAASAAGLALARELGSTFWIATLAATLGRAYILQRDLPAARATLHAVMPSEHQPRHMGERAVALAWGELALAQGTPEVALRIAEQLLASVPGSMPGRPAQLIPHLLHVQGAALLALARPDEAIAALEGAKRGARERNARPVLWAIHRTLGRASRLRRRREQAREELAAGRQLIAELASTIDDAPLRDQFARAALGSFPEERPTLPREAAKRAFNGLTTREREVAALVAEGRTSREIADLLVVSERTAEVHVSNILGKLGFTSRAQIAVWAVERGLAQA